MDRKEHNRFSLTFTGIINSVLPYIVHLNKSIVTVAYITKY